ncbi:MAG: hypothetical protein GKR95_21720 [Gammaproteobacteria bacterium]|nr:hypothetical protein [Gammaproteobacteria bacterium]
MARPRHFDTDQVKNKKIFIHYGATSFGHTYESKVIKYQSGMRTTARSRYVLSEDLFEENALRIDSSVEKAIKDNPARLIRHNFKTEVEDKLHIFLYELFSISGIYLNFVSTKRKDVDKAWNRLKDVINAVSKHTKELEKLEAKNHKKAYDFRKPIRIRGRAFREMQLCERQVYLYEILTDNLEQFKKLINPYRSYTLGFYKVLSDTEAENLAQTCTSIINSIYLCSNLFTAQQARNINKKIKDNKEAIHIISCPYNCLPYLTGFIHFEETSVMNVSSHLNTNTNMLYYNMEAFCKYFNAYREYKWTDTEKAERGVIKRLEKMGKIKKVFG